MTADSPLAPLNSAPSPAKILCWIWAKNYHQDSTEEELRKENMNVIVPVKSGEESVEIVDSGSGAEPSEVAKPKNETIKAKDEPKPTTAKPKKHKKKSKKHSEKKEELKSTTHKPTTKATSIEEEEQLGGDKILRFETVENVTEKITSIFVPQSEEKSESKEKSKSEEKSLLDEDEEIGEQKDTDSTVLHFEDMKPTN
jgi:hypothetical protein